MIGPNETEIIGRWVLDNGNVVPDPVSQRIALLISRHLVNLGSDPSGWDTLYRDPADGRLWEKSLSDSGQHGGGPPSLRWISVDEATRKFGQAATL